MPYIKKEDREFFDEAIDDLSLDVSTSGDLNYTQVFSLRLY